MATIQSALRKAFAFIPGFIGIRALILRLTNDSDMSADPSISAGSGAAANTDNAGSLWMRTDGQPEYRIGSTWYAVQLNGYTSGAQLLAPAGTAAAPGLAFAADVDTGLYSNAANVIGVAIAGVAALGIGGAAPTVTAATDTVGQDVYFKTAAAGGTATAARVGGLLSWTAGAGSTGSSGSGTVDAGDGGAVTYAAGAGGTASSTAGAQGGAGGAATVSAGAGGTAAGTDPGGAGGALIVESGVGGAKTGTGTANGGASGAVTVRSKDGGATASTSPGTGGAAGTVSITGGNGGAASAGTANGGKGGAVVIAAGTGGTSAGGTAGKDGVIIERSTRLVKQGAPTAKTTSATLTAAEVLAGIITVAQGAAGTSAQQLPTATDFDTALPDAAAGDAFDFSVINISTVAGEDASITTNTGWTLVGSMDVESDDNDRAASSGRFRARKTGAAAWTLYRVS